MAGVASGVATAVDGGPGGGGYSNGEAASLASLLSGVTDSDAAAARDGEGDPFAAGVSARVAAAVGFASRGGGDGGGGGGAAPIVLDLLGAGGGGGGGGVADGAALL